MIDFGRNASFDEGILSLLRNYNTEILHLVEIRLNIPVLLSAWLQGKWLIEEYNYLYLKRTRPTLVLTYVDNNLSFYRYSVINPEIKTMIIQNGIRGYCGDIFEQLHCKSASDPLKVDFMMTLGTHVGAEYGKFITGKVVPIGSFINNMALVRREKAKGTIAFVSQYREIRGVDMCGVFCSFEQFFERADRIILPFLVKYARSRGKALSIVPSSSSKGDPAMMEREKRYFNRIAGSKCTFFAQDGNSSSYDAIDGAEVTVAIDSTLGFEAIARGGRAAIFSIRSTILSLANPPFMNFGWPGVYPDNGPFWTNHPDPTGFERILDYLFSASEDDWRAELERWRFEDIVVFDPGNSILREVLRSQLGPGSDKCLEQLK